jgi:hypothetical protein
MRDLDFSKIVLTPWILKQRQFNERHCEGGAEKNKQETWNNTECRLYTQTGSKGRLWYYLPL